MYIVRKENTIRPLSICEECSTLLKKMFVKLVLAVFLLLLGGEGHGLYLPETDQGRISLPWMEDNGEKDTCRM